MATIFSLQGCMAVGKTTVVKYVENKMSTIYVSYENPLPLLSEIKERNLQQSTLEGFIEHYLKNMMPLKRNWFFEKRTKKPEILLVEGMSIEEVGESVLLWIKIILISTVE